MGLGSILGTGIFVSIGIAAGVAGPSVVLAVALAAVVATFNGLSSAQLAASHPVSGGTYEYGYRYLSPALGFTAGWMFLVAKSASAATAALGFGGYVLTALEVEGHLPRVALGLAVVGFLTAIVAGGMGRSNRANAVIVSLTLFALGPSCSPARRRRWPGADGSSFRSSRMTMTA
jgi:basic amino acid/polyamine antiporter, APA family